MAENRDEQPNLPHERLFFVENNFFKRQKMGPKTDKMTPKMNGFNT